VGATNNLTAVALAALKSGVDDATGDPLEKADGETLVAVVVAAPQPTKTTTASAESKRRMNFVVDGIAIT